ncbi:epoxide hydrolase family protein [Paraburkholderia youngii]|uniref:Epoxide hydrolase n=1 Tax=Paraburkholderia youngii TaxID=2782701 RepID=A0A7W8L9A8_9BURK|nr:epoxide hydrolase family protein [Paraburkholderia youngii]MBB5402862.1 pimeloyl-ACP methyl ester carboxylesterase [Paraburkholderia youngii]NVI05120.1 epoxide hydrolase [Paraburkholderia youngii]
MQIDPFEIAIADQDIDDLRHRIRATRWAPATPAPAWQQGADPAWLRELATYWAGQFDWRAAERKLNQLPQFLADVNGQTVHFAHRRAASVTPGFQAYPLVITHGWPGSFFEFHALLDQLCDPAAFGADPADAFDVVTPSLPGFAFSPAPAQAGMSAFQVADLWASLMRGLGYERFGAQGGDLGAGVSIALAAHHPRVVDGIHLNFLPTSYEPAIGAAQRELTPAERDYLREKNDWAALEGGYAHQHSTKPLTVAASLNDSPVGLAAWIGEKFRAWSDCDGDVESVFSIDELLTNISLYWFTQCIGPAMQMYWENRLQPMRFTDGERIDTPVGFALFPKEINHPPRSWLERTFNVVQWSEMPAGGHFAAMEKPELLAAEIRKFFRPLRQKTR